MLPVGTLEAAAASSSNPRLPKIEGVKIGTLGSADITIVEVADVRPMWKSWWELHMKVRMGAACPHAVGAC